MQMSAFRGSRTVMSLRLCSRAPWTTSSSAAIRSAILPCERVFVQSLRERACYALRQRPKTRPPSVKPSPKVPTAKPPIARPLRQADRRCQRPSASSSSARQRLAAPLLPQRAAGPDAEVEVVEDLVRSLVRHSAHCSLLRRCQRASSTCPTSTSARGTGSTTRRSSGRSRARRAGRAGARGRERRPDAPRPARRARGGGAPSCAASAPPLLVVPGQPRHPARSRRPGFTHPWREFERQWRDDAAGALARPALHVVGLNSVRPWRHQSRRRSATASSSAATRRLARGARRARCASSSLHHQLVGAPWRTRKKPLARADARARALVDAGAELIVGGHVHQAAIVRAARVRGASPTARAACVVATAPGLGRPRPNRRGEARGVARLQRRRAARSPSRRYIWRDDGWALTGGPRVPARQPSRSRRLRGRPSALRGASASARELAAQLLDLVAELRRVLEPQLLGGREHLLLERDHELLELAAVDALDLLAAARALRDVRRLERRGTRRCRRRPS